MSDSASSWGSAGPYELPATTHSYLSRAAASLTDASSFSSAGSSP